MEKARHTSDSPLPDRGDTAAPISSGVQGGEVNLWTERLVLFLRAMAVLALLKGLYHWAAVCGFFGARYAFDAQPLAWQTATVYFAVIELVAAVGLWLATPWGAVVWLTTVVSRAVIALMFPQVFGGGFLMILGELLLLGGYLALAWMSARERPP
jgi:hypothetical protein